MNELDAFLELTTQRLPSAKELIDLCGALHVFFRVSNGRPVLRGGPDTRNIREVLAKVITREPWRSQVIEYTGLDVEKQQQESDWAAADRMLEPEGWKTEALD